MGQDSRNRPAGGDSSASEGDLDAALDAFLAEEVELEGAASPEAAADDEPFDIGHYRIEHELGRGAQGAVYLAHDRALDRTVAVKFLSSLAAGSRERRLRFEREARVASRLHHPAICSVYGSGRHEGIPYIVMQYVEGETLSARLGRVQGSGSAPGRAELRFSIGLVIELADALHRAHEAGVVHRDVKPGNVMITPKGTPVLLDFGFALEETESLHLTATGSTLGTPAYMAPEQVEPGRGPVDRRADVHALGVTLFECLTWRRPYGGATREAVYRSLLLDSPPDPRSLNPAVTRDLRTVVETALEKDVGRRYQTAKVLADDLRAVRAGRPVSARPIGPLTQAGRWARRNRLVATLSLLLFLILAAGVLLLAGKTRDARRSEQQTLRLLEIESMRTLEPRLEEVATLWPIEAALAPRIEAWLAGMEALVDELPRRRETLANLREEAPADAQRMRNLEALIDRLEHLGERKELGAARARLRLVREIGRISLEDHAATWRACVDAIESDPRYDDVHLSPIWGLVPLGTGPQGLPEFLHLPTHEGPLPRRLPDGSLEITADTGIVLVLIPPQRFTQGARWPDAGRSDYLEHRSRTALPAHTVTLDAYFIGKFEVTQGQWYRITAGRPSTHEEYGPLHPVESVSRDECEAALARVCLSLPTESQWECAARGGTTDPWWCGATRESLRGHVNLADATADDDGATWAPNDRVPDYEDGFVTTAPVDTLSPNPFGLHHVLGNVEEWCRDDLVYYAAAPPRPGDGLREALTDYGVCRGGSYRQGTVELRCAARSSASPRQIAPNLGVRASRGLEP